MPWKKRAAPWTSRTSTWRACPPPTEPPRASCAFADEHGREKPAQFLKRAWDYLDAEGLAGDELVREWMAASPGTSTHARPHPALHPRDRQPLPGEGLDDGHAPATPYDLFATEGGTAAMCYLFYSLKCNFLVNPGDRMSRS